MIATVTVTVTVMVTVTVTVVTAVTVTTLYRLPQVSPGKFSGQSVDHHELHALERSNG